MSAVVTAVTLGLIVIGVVLVMLGVLGKNKSFGYTKRFGYYQDRTYNVINGKYANIASVVVGILFIAIALIVYFR
jgi:hypothetical protein